MRNLTEIKNKIYQAPDIPVELRPLVPGFLRRRDREIAELRVLLTSHNYEAIGFIAHKLKGTGTGYGFPLVTDLGEALGEAAKMKSDDLIAEVIEALVDAVTELKVRFPN